MSNAKFWNGSRWIFHCYTCPKCKAKEAFEQYQDESPCMCVCKECGHEESAYCAPMDEWPRVTFRRGDD